MLPGPRYVSMPNLRKFSSNRFSDLSFLLLSPWDPYTMNVSMLGVVLGILKVSSFFYSFVFALYTERLTVFCLPDCLCILLYLPTSC